MGLRWKVAQAAEIRWWQSYLKKKDKTDYLSWKKNYWTEFLTKTEIELSSPNRILDAGCGPAGIFIVLQDYDTHALDPLLEEYETKLEHFKAKDYPSVQFHPLPLEELDDQEQFDTVFCLNAINHVADLDQCFDNLLKATKPGGKLIVSIDAHNYKFFKHIFRLLPGDILHPHQFDLKEYENMLTKRGCTIKKRACLKKEFFFDYHVLVCEKK